MPAALARVGLIHATPLAMDPIHQAFKEVWPAADIFDLLDTSLTADRDAGVPIMDFGNRIGSLVSHALMSGAVGILFTCAAFGTPIGQAASTTSVPVMKPNEPMFMKAMSMGMRVGLVVTHEPALPDLVEEFRALAGGRAQLLPVFAAGAFKALRMGNFERHDRLVAEAAAELASPDVIMLAQFSTARAAPLVRAQLHREVLTAPTEAVEALKSAVERREQCSQKLGILA